MLTKDDEIAILMKKLKAGEITRNELFDRIAKLQNINANESTQIDKIETESIPIPPSVNPLPPQPLYYTEPRNAIRAQYPSMPGATQLGSSKVNSSVNSPTEANRKPKVLAQRTIVPDTKVVVQQSKGENGDSFLHNGGHHENKNRVTVKEWLANKSRSSLVPSLIHAQNSQIQGTMYVDQNSDNMHYGKDLNRSQSILTGQLNKQLPLDSTQDQTHELRRQNDDNQEISAQRLNGSIVESKIADDQKFRIGYVYNPAHLYNDGTHQDQNLNGIENENSSNIVSDASRFLQSCAKTRQNNDSPDSHTSRIAKEFHARVTRWRSQKDAVREQLKQELLKAELSQCTFTPALTRKTIKVATQLRQREDLNEVSESERKKGFRNLTPQEVSERLYHEAENYRIREEMAARKKAEEDAKIQQECTFTPQINRAKDHLSGDTVKAKYMDNYGMKKQLSAAAAAAAKEAVEKELKECTFNPKVNPISEEMISAQLYVQQDIYERLSRPACMDENNYEQDDEDQQIDNLDIDGLSLRPPNFRELHTQRQHSRMEPHPMQRAKFGSFSPTRSHPFRVQHRQRSHSADFSYEEVQYRQEHSEVESNEQVERKLTKRQAMKSFNNFIERQRFHAQVRKNKIESVKEQLRPQHKPTINNTSKLMMKNGRKGDFLERIANHITKKQNLSLKARNVKVSDPNCTFKPMINTTSAKRKGRSITELSRGDLLRRETTQRLMKLKRERDEMAALTFKPQLNPVSERASGKLQILASPETYLERLQHHNQMSSVRQRQILQEKERQEFQECTFKPRTIEAPAYVHRIAKNVLITKELKKQQQRRVAEKPEWK